MVVLPVRTGDATTGYILMDRNTAGLKEAFLAGFVRFNLMILAPFFVVVLVVSRALSYATLEPIHRLAEGMNRVRAGDLAGELRFDTRDEFQTLARSYNRMLEDLRLKRELQHYLSDAAHAAVAERLRRKGDERILAEEVELAIPFADIVKFSHLSNRYRPPEVVAVLNEFFSRVVEVVEGAGGVVDKFVGDEVVAFFTKNLFADRALAAARAILRACREPFRIGEARALPGALRVRVGLHASSRLGLCGHGVALGVRALGATCHGPPHPTPAERMAMREAARASAWPRRDTSVILAFGDDPIV